MALAIFGAMNDVINKSAAAVIDSEILPRSAELMNTVFKATFDGVESVVKQIQDITKPDPAPPPGP